MQALEEHFSEAGEVGYAKVLDGAQQPQGVVEFPRPEEAARAVLIMDECPGKMMSGESCLFLSYHFAVALLPPPPSSRRRRLPLAHLNHCAAPANRTFHSHRYGWNYGSLMHLSVAYRGRNGSRLFFSIGVLIALVGIRPGP